MFKKKNYALKKAKFVEIISKKKSNLQSFKSKPKQSWNFWNTNEIREKKKSALKSSWKKRSRLSSAALTPFRISSDLQQQQQLYISSYGYGYGLKSH